MLKTIYLLHHSHTDIGFTHPQPTVRFLQQRFIDEALELIEKTSDFPEASRFRWTCETLLPVLDWFERTDSRQQDRFLKAERCGTIEVTACWAVMTQCAPMKAWEYMMEKVDSLCHQYGLSIRSAMHSDINGMPWMLPDLLAERGIDRFSMAINEHFGKSSLPRPRPYVWRGPKGGQIKVWNGLHYNANQFFGIPYDVEAARSGVGKLEQWLQTNGYQEDFLLFQVTRPDFNDNGGPDRRLSSFVRDWNARDLMPRMEIVTLSGFFDAVNPQVFSTAPEITGEWTDFWNFGAASTPYESGLNRRVYSIITDTLCLAERLEPAASEQIKHLVDEAMEQAVTFDEHTWGSDSSISSPFSEAARSGLHFKKHYAYAAEAAAKIARAEALEALKAQVPSACRGPSILLVNTLSEARSVAVDIPVEWLRVDVSPTRSHQHRMQYLPVRFPDLGVPLPEHPVPIPFQGAESVRIKVNLPANGDLLIDGPQIFSIGTAQKKSAAEAGTRLETDRFAVRLSPETGGLISLFDKFQNRELLSSDPLSPFGVPVRETPQNGSRDEIHPTPDWTRFMGYKGWKTNWKAVRTPMTPAGSAQVWKIGNQHFLRQSLQSAFANGGHWELVLDEDSEHVELRVTVDFRWDEIPSAWYVPLRFALSHPCFEYDNCETTIRLGRDQIPNANMDYQTVHRWVELSGNEGKVQLVPRDTPLISMGGFYFGRMTGPHTPRDPMLLVWLQSNYWDTNFAASSFGPFEARFFIKFSSHQKKISRTEFAESVLHPVLVQPAFR